MKNLIVGLLAITFYFTMEAPAEIPGVTMRTDVSGFKSKAVCEAYKAQTESALQQFGMEVKFSSCLRRDDA